MAETATTGEITVDVRGFQRQTVRILREYGEEIGPFMEKRAASWSKNLANNFPPSRQMFSKGQWGDRVAGLGATTERRLGENRIEKDIRKVFQPLPRSTVKWQTEDRDAWIFKTAQGAVYGVDKDLYRPQAGNAELSRQHERFRGKNGRVTTARYNGRTGAINKPIGRWKFVDVMHVHTDRLKSYIREKKKSTGKLKGGWVAGITFFGGKAPAKWISRHRHGGGAWGSIDEMGNGALHAKNSVPYASQYERIVRHTARLMDKNLESQLKYMMRKNAKRWSEMKEA